MTRRLPPPHRRAGPGRRAGGERGAKLVERDGFLRARCPCYGHILPGFSRDRLVPEERLRTHEYASQVRQLRGVLALLSSRTLAPCNANLALHRHQPCAGSRSRRHSGHALVAGCRAGSRLSVRMGGTPAIRTQSPRHLPVSVVVAARRFSHVEMHLARPHRRGTAAHGLLARGNRRACARVPPIVSRFASDRSYVRSRLPLGSAAALLRPAVPARGRGARGRTASANRAAARFTPTQRRSAVARRAVTRFSRARVRDCGFSLMWITSGLMTRNLLQSHPADWHGIYRRCAGCKLN